MKIYCSQHEDGDIAYDCHQFLITAVTIKSPAPLIAQRFSLLGRLALRRLFGTTPDQL